MATSPTDPTGAYLNELDRVRLGSVMENALGNAFRYNTFGDKLDDGDVGSNGITKSGGVYKRTINLDTNSGGLGTPAAGTATVLVLIGSNNDDTDPSGVYVPVPGVSVKFELGSDWTQVQLSTRQEASHRPSDTIGQTFNYSVHVIYRVHDGSTDPSTVTVQLTDVEYTTANYQVFALNWANGFTSVTDLSVGVAINEVHDDYPGSEPYSGSTTISRASLDTRANLVAIAAGYTTSEVYDFSSSGWTTGNSPNSSTVDQQAQFRTGVTSATATWDTTSGFSSVTNYERVAVMLDLVADEGTGSYRYPDLAWPKGALGMSSTQVLSCYSYSNNSVSVAELALHTAGASSLTASETYELVRTNSVRPYLLPVDATTAIVLAVTGVGTYELTAYVVDISGGTISVTQGDTVSLSAYPIWVFMQDTTTAIAAEQQGANVVFRSFSASTGTAGSTATWSHAAAYHYQFIAVSDELCAVANSDASTVYLVNYTTGTLVDSIAFGDVLGALDTEYSLSSYSWSYRELWHNSHAFPLGGTRFGVVHGAYVAYEDPAYYEFFPLVVEEYDFASSTLSRVSLTVLDSTPTEDVNEEWYRYNDPVGSAVYSSILGMPRGDQYASASPDSVIFMDSGYWQNLNGSSTDDAMFIWRLPYSSGLQDPDIVNHYELLPHDYSDGDPDNDYFGWSYYDTGQYLDDVGSSYVGFYEEYSGTSANDGVYLALITAAGVDVGFVPLRMKQRDDGLKVPAGNAQNIKPYGSSSHASGRIKSRNFYF